MILYKNVDICDLESILAKGILSLDSSGNNNWEDGKRASNPTDRVYLFSPLEEKSNTFPNYGVALVEVDVEDARKIDCKENDAHRDDYFEYTISEVSPDQIRRIIIPKIFSERFSFADTVTKMVEWCSMSAMVYTEKGFEPVKDEVLKRFAKTAEIEDSSCFNFFRGINEKNQMIDLYEIKYIF